jgi:hypothetical protein
MRTVFRSIGIDVTAEGMAQARRRRLDAAAKHTPARQAARISGCPVGWLGSGASCPMVSGVGGSADLRLFAGLVGGPVLPVPR